MFGDFGVWESLEFRRFREPENVGSNPITPTGILRRCSCWYGRASVKRHLAGSIPAAAAWGSTRLSCSWPSGLRHRSSKPDRRVRFPQSTSQFDVVTIGDRLTVGCLALNQVVEVQVLLPELRTLSDPGQSLLVVTPGSEPGVRWFDSNPRNLFAARLSRCTEVIRPDEEPVSKTGGDLLGACGFESHGFRLLRLHRSPVVQRRRLLAYTQATRVRFPSGPFTICAQVRQLAERLGLNQQLSPPSDERG
jgi:hypothetical protein